MTDRASSLYNGIVTHRRVRPREHRLRYRIFSLLLDLDEIDGLARQLRLFSQGRFNLFSFHDRDYGDGSDTPLRTQVERHMHAAGFNPDGGPIRLLTMPRILGYAFNPISVYFCYRRAGALAAILYEVNNTFGERHSYLIPADGVGDGPVVQTCPKQFHVSPFMDMAMTYHFRVMPPGKRVAIRIAGHDADGLVIATALSAERAALTNSALARAFVAYPLMTLAVVAGIHWEALLIWLKGVRPRRRPPAPDRPVTVTHPIAIPSTTHKDCPQHVLQ